MSGKFVIFLQNQGSHSEISEALRKVGLRGEGFTEARGFLKRLRDGGPLACLVDLSGEDSPIMLALIKSVRGVLGARLPVLGIVPANDTALEAKAKVAGANDVLVRPVDEDELIAAIAKHAAASDSKEIEVPKLIQWFFETLSPAMAGLSSALENLGEIEAQVRFYESRLMHHRENFVNMISAMRKTKVKSDLTQCIRMYGIGNTRNLVVAMRLTQVSQVPLVGWNAKTGALAGEPKQALKFAIKALEHFGEGSRNQSEAFNSGLVMDLLFAMADTTGARKAPLRRFIEDRFVDGLRRADISIAEAKKAKKLALDKHIISAILMREAGKAAMALFFPEYLEMRRKFDKKFLRPQLQHIAELRYFSVSHNLMGALVCQGAPGLSDAYKAVLFFDYPYMLREIVGDSDSYDLLKVCNPV